MPYRVRVYVHRRVTRLDVASRRVASLESRARLVCIHLLVLDLNIHVYLTTTSMPHIQDGQRGTRTLKRRPWRSRRGAEERQVPSFPCEPKRSGLSGSSLQPLHCMREVGVRFWPSASHRTRSHAHALT